MAESPLQYIDDIVPGGSYSNKGLAWQQISNDYARSAFRYAGFQTPFDPGQFYQVDEKRAVHRQCGCALRGYQGRFVRLSPDPAAQRQHRLHRHSGVEGRQLRRPAAQLQHDRRVVARSAAARGGVQGDDAPGADRHRLQAHRQLGLLPFHRRQS
ncbi:hypothetical protein G6F31_018221 [Rhizopus arrhizus]|nr:hypothetical protein G6F31_018221 [Rhizopus arrhizus]